MTMLDNFLEGSSGGDDARRHNYSLDANGGCMEFQRTESPNSADNAFQFMISTYCLIGVAALGILGNFLSILILSRPQMKSSISAVLLGLAACDTLLIVTSILLFSLTTVYPYTGYLRNYYYFW